MGATADLAKWITETSYEEVPPEAFRTANESCFDCMGVMLAGASHTIGKTILQYVRDLGGSPEATVVAAGFKTSASQAALANGTLGHAHDYDDFGGFGHPTTVVFPAVLALGERIKATGKEMLGAYIIGVEVGIALTAGGGGLHGKYNQMKRGFHGTAIFGRMAAAAACSKLLGLDQPKTTMALGIAGSMASGLIHNFGTMTKPLHPGMAARDGVMAAELASRGWTAGDQILEHPLGFVNTFFGEDMANPPDLVKGLGKPFRIQEALIVKKYPTCGGNHSFLDALLGIIHENNLAYDDIESVRIDNQSYISVVQIYQEPKDGLTGKFSILYNAARAILDGKVTMDTFTDEAAADPRVKEAMKKLDIPVVPKWHADAVLAANPVTVRTKDGRTFTKTVEVKDVLGSQRNPWGMESITAKFKECARRVLSEKQVEEAIRTWSRIDKITSLEAALKKVTANGR